MLVLYEYSVFFFKMEKTKYHQYTIMYIGKNNQCPKKNQTFNLANKGYGYSA